MTADRRSWSFPLAAACAGLALLFSVLAGCSNDSNQQTLTVFAAASLTETFTSLEADFEKDHPGVKVQISFGSSSALAQQITSGSPADVIATADDKSIGIVSDAGDLDGSPTPFATNTMVIVTPPDNPGQVTSLADLQDADFVVCDPSVPCGAAAATILANAGITTKPRSLEEDVKAVLTKVTLDEADAGIVYVTDAQAAGTDVSTVDIGPDDNVVNSYVMGVVKGSAETELAKQWIQLVTSQAGQGVLTAAGFGAAP